MDRDGDISSRDTIKGKTGTATTNDNDMGGPGGDGLSSQSPTTFVDITAILKKAAQSLSFQRPMLHNDKGFSLQDSMAALELTDKKMDGCEVPVPLVFDFVTTNALSSAPNDSNGSNNNNKKKSDKFTDHNEQTERKFVSDGIDEGCRTVFPRPAPTGLDDKVEPLPWNELTLEDSAFVGIQNLILLESLLGGLSIVESTYLSLYAHPPVMRDMKERLGVAPGENASNILALNEQLDAMTTGADTKSTSSLQNLTKSTLSQHVVYASTLMMVEFTDLFRNVVLNADIFEEEDFTVNTYSFPVFNDTDEASSLKVTSSVERMLQSEIKKGEWKDSAEENFAKMNLLTIEVQLDLYTIVSTLARLTGTDVQREAHEKQKLVQKVAKKMDDIVHQYKCIRQYQSDKSKMVLLKTFNTYINRPLIGNAPVRKVLVTDPLQSLSNLGKIIGEIDWVVCRTLLKGGTMGRVRRMLGQVSTCSINILSRSLLILNLYFDDRVFGQYPLPEMIARYMQQLAFTPDHVFHHPSSQAFLGRLCKPVYDTLKLLALNRNRQRSYLDVMLGDWAALRQEAYLVDMACHEGDDVQGEEVHPYFTLFVLFLTITLMDHYVELGVELQLFCTEYDLMTAFWYRDFLLSALLNQINTLRQMKQQMKQTLALEQKQQQQDPSSRATKGSKKKGKSKKSTGGPNTANGKANTESIFAPTEEDIEDEYDLYVWNMKRVMCRGLVRFFAALRQGGLIEEKKYEFTSERKIFDKRFEIFSVIQQPPPLSYDDFMKGTDFENITSQDLIASTEECFMAGKSFVDRMAQLAPTIDVDFLTVKPEELNRIGKVCFGNKIYIQKLKQIILEKKDGVNHSASVSIDNKAHSQYCTLVVKS